VETTAIAVRPEAPASFLDTLRPRDRIAMATEIADAIKDVIVQKGWLKRIGESDHVYVEGWQFVASLAGASCKVVSSEPLADGKGWQARAVVVRIDTGVEIGAGSGMCSRDERTWAKREDYALRAMAETRSMSRALRGVFSFIVELAGYRATPAEEMPDHDAAPLRETAPTSRHSQRVARLPQDELLALAASRGLADLAALGRWCVAEGIAPDLMDRAPKKLSDAETVAARDRLLALPEVGIAPPPPAPAAWRMTHPQRGLLMRAYAGAWGSGKGDVTEEKRHAFAERVLGPGKGSSATWDRADFDRIIKALEAEERAGLRAHARAMFGDES
jgi:hypothetical protein